MIPTSKFKSIQIFPLIPMRLSYSLYRIYDACQAQMLISMQYLSIATLCNNHNTQIMPYNQLLFTSRNLETANLGTSKPTQSDFFHCS